MRTRLEIAQDLLGGKIDENGYAPCPGIDRHTKGAGDRDFRVILTGAPTGFCFHSSCGAEVEEFNEKLRKAIWREENGGKPQTDSQYGKTAAAPKAKPAARPPINRELLAEFTRGVPAVSEEWLARRSPVDVSTVTPGDFLSAIFNMNERVLVFTTQYSQGDFIWWVGRGGFRLSQDRGIKAVPSDLPNGSADGVWYLVQPVTGNWAVKRNVKWSEDEEGRKSRDVKGAYTRRSEENVTDWRHFVLESDVLAPEEWLRVLVSLDLAVVAAYTSGGRSIHAIVKMPVASKQIWDASRNVLRQVLCVLGADPAALSAVRLSRLPGCLRGNKMQKLLFLSPDADPKQKIHLMPELR